MTKPNVRQTTVDDITPLEMESAMKLARAKKARLLAEQALGIGDDSMPVIKGPAKVPGERICEITLDLAPHSDRLIIDSATYMHGRTYKVPERVYKSMTEMIARGWQHQEEVDGKDRNFYRKSKTVKLSPASVGLPA